VAVGAGSEHSLMSDSSALPNSSQLTDFFPLVDPAPVDLGPGPVSLFNALNDHKSVKLHPKSPNLGACAQVIRLENASTGGQIEIEITADGRSQYRFALACKGLDRLCLEHGLVKYFLTLTLSDDYLRGGNEMISAFTHWLQVAFKRLGVEFAYVWAVELQRKRYLKYGKAALHWHVVVVCPLGSLPHVEYSGVGPRRRLYVVGDGSVVANGRLVERWGKGIVFSQLVRSPTVFGYIGKYFTKDYGAVRGFKSEWLKLRRFGCSNLSFRRWPRWAFDWVGSEISNQPDVKDLYFVRSGSKARIRAKSADGAFVDVAACKSPWRAVFVSSGGQK
jgi:hypothetical protein